MVLDSVEGHSLFFSFLINNSNNFVYFNKLFINLIWDILGEFVLENLHCRRTTDEL